MKTRFAKGFTLIELLIVVAIIAILAAIAVPNFLEAQTRSKVSRSLADMRSIATALEAYRVDGNDYPLDSNFYYEPWGRHPKPDPIPPPPALFLYLLTTPVAYMTSVPSSPFPNSNDTSQPKAFYYDYVATDWIYTQNIFRPFLSQGIAKASFCGWVLASWGPDRHSSNGVYVIYSPRIFETISGGIYDATNGTISEGDIIRFGP